MSPLLGQPITYWIEVQRVLEQHRLTDVSDLEAVLNHEQTITERRAKDMVTRRLGDLFK